MDFTHYDLRQRRTATKLFRRDTTDTTPREAGGAGDLGGILRAVEAAVRIAAEPHTDHPEPSVAGHYTVTFCPRQRVRPLPRPRSP